VKRRCMQSIENEVSKLAYDSAILHRERMRLRERERGERERRARARARVKDTDRQRGGGSVEWGRVVLGAPSEVSIATAH
jgi:hypothetical protein